MKYPETLLLKLPEGTKARLSEHGNVQAFVRRAIELLLNDPVGRCGPEKLASLSDVQKPVAPKIPRKNSGVKSELSSNGKILLEAIRKRQIVSRREVKRDFGWDDPALLKASLELRGHVKMDTEKFWV